MNQRHKILSLADFLIKSGLEKEASELLSLFDKEAQVSPPTVEAWYKVLGEIDSDYVDPAYQTVKRYLVAGSQQLKKAAEGLKDTSKEDMEKLLEQVPLEQIIRSASERENLIKYASNINDDPLEVAAKFCKEQGFDKEAGLLGSLIPFASLIFGVVNFYYCAIEFSKLMSEVPAAGLEWYEPLMPNNLMDAAKKNQDAPDKLRILGKATKTSETFVDQFISLVANTIDGIKDIIFMVANFATGFLASVFDLGISFIIMLIEWAVKGQALAVYKQVIAFIRNRSVEEIKEHEMKSFDSLWGSTESEETPAK